MIGDTCNDFPETEASTAGESSDTACVSETLADVSAKSDLPGLNAENDSVIESSKNEIGVQRSDQNSTSNVQGRGDVTEDAEKRENKISFHPQVEVELDRNSAKSGNSVEDLNRDTLGNLNTIQLDSTTQRKSDDDSDFKTNKTEIPPVDEVQTIDQNKTSDVSANAMETGNGEAGSVIEIAKKSRMVQQVSNNAIESAPGENVATEEDVKNVPSQVISDGQVKASQMYPKLHSLAGEAGIYPFTFTTSHVIKAMFILATLDSHCTSTKWIGLLFTHKNAEFGTISVVNGVKLHGSNLESGAHHILDRFWAKLWCSMNRYLVCSRSE